MSKPKGTITLAPRFTNVHLNGGQVRVWSEQEVTEYLLGVVRWKRWGWAHKRYPLFGRLPSAIATRLGVPRRKPDESSVVIQNFLFQNVPSAALYLEAPPT